MYLLFFSLTSNASYDYSLISDDTTIEEDFSILGMDISNYYKPISYDYEKWYVIGMSEAYLQEYDQIQTYFYFYNPTMYGEGSDYMSTVSSFRFTSTLNDTEQASGGTKLDYNKEHCIYKVKGFSYDYIEKAIIRISQVQHYNMRGLGITSDSTFQATVTHSKQAGFNVELGFNTTLILEEYEAVDVYIPRDDRGFFNQIANLWDDVWLGTSKELWLTFYNFNFPKDIQPDSIEYAKFSYETTFNQIQIVNGTTKSDISYTEKEIKEYTPGTHTFQANKRSEELTFETFVLGDRIQKGEFGYLEFTKEAKEKFKYDASILLDSRINTFSTAMINEYTSSTIIKRRSISNIEFLEMHYMKDGILYKCQIITQPVNPTPVRPTVKKSWWEKFLEFLVKMFDFIFFQQLGYSFWIPDIAKQIISGIILAVVVFIVIPYILKKAIKGIKKLFGR